jgi:hypothetical protein
MGMRMRGQHTRAPLTVSSISRVMVSLMMQATRTIHAHAHCTGHPAHLTVSPVPMSRLYSVSSFKSENTASLQGDGWNEVQMLVFVDDVRAALWNAHVPVTKTMEDVKRNREGADEDHSGARERESTKHLVPSFRKMPTSTATTHEELSHLLPSLLGILNSLVQEEEADYKPVELDFVVHTHLDRLLAEIPHYVEVLSSFPAVLVQARVLDASWQHRFGNRWGMIRAQRDKEAMTTGLRREMRKLSLASTWKIGDDLGWVINRVTPGADGEGHLGIRPGQ